MTKQAEKVSVGFALVLSLTLSFTVGCGNDKSRDPSNPKEKVTTTGRAFYPYAQLHTSSNYEKSADYDYPNPANFPNETLRGQYIAPKRLINLVDIMNVDPDLQLSPHFKLVEVMSHVKGAYGIFSPSVIVYLENIRAAVGTPIWITSGYRSPGYNRRTDGSAGFSRHMYGDGVDFVAKDLAPSELKDKCLENGASFYQVYKSHIHCDWRLEPLDPAFYDRAPTMDPRTDVDPYGALATLAEIYWESVGESLHVTAELPYKEDDDELLYSWNIKLPNGEIVTSEKSIVQIPKINGSYKITAVIGESVTIERELTW